MVEGVVIENNFSVPVYTEYVYYILCTGKTCRLWCIIPTPRQNKGVSKHVQARMTTTAPRKTWLLKDFIYAEILMQLMQLILFTAWEQKEHTTSTHSLCVRETCKYMTSARIKAWSNQWRLQVKQLAVGWRLTSKIYAVGTQRRWKVC